MSDGVKGQTADVIVLGAGIVGVSATYAIWQRGLSVILIDRREPGNEASYGAASRRSSETLRSSDVVTLATCTNSAEPSARVGRAIA
jgi:2-polyprenyl-6-methoxyphenol hydroxylase-like FAD-dependent oxidoreductase